MRHVIALAALVSVLAAHPASAAVEEPAGAEAGAAQSVEVESGESAVAAAAAGCRKVDVAKTGRDLFGFVVYRFHHVKRWCWRFPRITSVQVWTYVSDVDPNMEYDGIVGASSHYYRWCCLNSASGHYSFRQAKFRNCILWFPCTRTEYPWVRVWARANGSYRWSRGLS